MKRSVQGAWWVHGVELVPSIVFLGLWRSGVALETAGWFGALAAACQLAAFGYRRIRHDTIMLGINIHLLVVTPLIVATLRFGAADLGALLMSHSYRGVLLSVFVTGCFLTAASDRGFLGVRGPDPSDHQRNSAIMLGFSALVALWALVHDGGSLIGVVLPMTALFSLRRLLGARIAKKSPHARGGLV